MGKSKYEKRGFGVSTRHLPLSDSSFTLSFCRACKVFFGGFVVRIEKMFSCRFSLA